MLRDSLLLIRTYLLIDWRKGFARSGLLLVLLYLLVFGGALIVAAASGAAGYGFGRLVNLPDLPVRISQGLFPGMLLTLVLVGVLVAGLNQAVRSLYLSGDLEQLVVAPIQTRTIMVAKLAGRMPWNVIFLLILVAPAIIAYGAGISAGAGYYLAGIVLIVLAPLFGLSFGALIAMFLVRWLPAKRLSELLAAAYAVLGLTVGLLAQLPRLFSDSDFATPQNLETINETLDAASRSPIPSLWAGQGMVDLGAGQVGLGLSRMIAYVVLTLGLFVFTIFVADRLYLAGWLRMQGTATKRRSLSEESGRLRSNSLQTTIGMKDWLLRVRDPRQLVGLVGGAIFGIVIGALTLFRGSGDSDGLMTAAQSGAIDGAVPYPFLSALFSPGLLVSAGILLVGYVIFATIASTSLALEGKSFDILKAAPVSGREVWWAKNNGVLVPYFVFVTILFALAWVFLRFSLAWSLYGWLVLHIAGAGLVSTNTSIGFRFSDFEWTDPKKMTTGGGGLLSLILTLIYFIICGLIAVTFFLLAVTFPAVAIPLALVGLVILSGGTWLWMRIQASWADRTWARLGE